MKNRILCLSILLSLMAAFTLPAQNAGRISDSLAFVNAPWKITDLGKGARAGYAQINMFNSVQSVSFVSYPARNFRTEILHRPADTAGKPSEIGKETGACFMMNAGYFNVKELTPCVYFRQGKQILGHTHPTELYRVDGVFGFTDRKGREMVVAHCPDSLDYEAVSRKMKSVMASGPLLILDGDIVVPVLMGDKADGASIYETAYICHLFGMTDAINLDGGGSSALWTSTTGVISHPRDNRRFDHEGERTVPNLIAVY